MQQFKIGADGGLVVYSTCARAVRPARAGRSPRTVRV